MIPFNSRDKYYKSNISAIATDFNEHLRIVVPRAFKCSAAFLVVKKEGEDYVRYGMFWAGINSNDFENWELHFSATTPGLYWYHFELETPWGINVLGNAGRGMGEFGKVDCDFQQTVYDKYFQTPSFLKGGLIYQIFPDRFFKSEKLKKNVPKSRVMRSWGEEPFWKEEQMNGVWNNDYFGGDLKGIEEKLPYISSLGVTCIYLNPIFESHTNHRYDTADYEKIDSLLGSEADLKSLCKTAKEKYGISIILDGVFSHTGCDSRYFNMYSRYADLGACNSKSSPYYSWYKFIKWPDEYQSWWGIRLLPEINEENESYRKYICSENGILRRWMKCGISGWRLDVADELPDVFLDDLRKAVKEENPQAVIIGEVWENAVTKEAYSQRRRYLLGEQLDSVMNYPFANAILDFVRDGNSKAFENSIMDIVESYPPIVLNILMNHIGTHDTQRAITRLAGERCDGCSREWQYEHNVLSKEKFRRGIKMLRLASLLQYTLPGVPSLYYGDEVGLQGMKDPFNRGCMNWEHQNKELLKWYVRLGEIRHAYSAFKDGEINFIYASNGAVAYERRSKNGAVLVAVNTQNEKIRINIGEWKNSYNVFSSELCGEVLSLPALGYALFSADS